MNPHRISEENFLSKLNQTNNNDTNNNSEENNNNNNNGNLSTNNPNSTIKNTSNNDNQHLPLLSPEDEKRLQGLYEDRLFHDNVRHLIQDDRKISIPVRLLNAEFTCAVCLGIIRNATAVMECLHRFCAQCVEKSLRYGKKECPACRVPCPSRRNLRADLEFDMLINKIYPDLAKADQIQDSMVNAIIASHNVTQFAHSAVKAVRKQIETARKSRVSSLPGDEELRAIREQKRREEEEAKKRAAEESFRAANPLPKRLKSNAPACRFVLLPHSNVHLLHYSNKDANVSSSLSPNPRLTCDSSSFKLPKPWIRVGGDTPIALVCKYLMIKFNVKTLSDGRPKHRFVLSIPVWGEKPSNLYTLPESDSKTSNSMQIDNNTNNTNESTKTPYYVALDENLTLGEIKSLYWSDKKNIKNPSKEESLQIQTLINFWQQLDFGNHNHNHNNNNNYNSDHLDWTSRLKQAAKHLALRSGMQLENDADLEPLKPRLTIFYSVVATVTGAAPAHTAPPS